MAHFNNVDEAVTYIRELLQEQVDFKVIHYPWGTKEKPDIGVFESKKQPVFIKKGEKK